MFCKTPHGHADTVHMQDLNAFSVVELYCESLSRGDIVRSSPLQKYLVRGSVFCGACCRIAVLWLHRWKHQASAQHSHFLKALLSSA